jgi:hypothetical protein
VSKKLPFWNFEVTEAPAQVRNAIDHPILNRYNEVIMGFLNGSGPIDEIELLMLLRTKAEQKGINISMWASEQPFLSDIAFDIVPHWWLRDAVDVSEKSPGEFLMKIDDAVCVPRVGTRVYALAAAIILDGETCDVSAARREKPIIYLD